MCEPCQLGKTCKLPFSSSDFRSSRVLERIHSNVWGPAPAVSAQGFRYYVVFIDNYSRLCWLYPMKSKSDVFSIFKVFQLQVETQYEQKIKVFQSDGGGEFVNKQLAQHFSDCGIKHIMSCPHTSEQNGLAESRHRHITELGMSMLFQSHLPDVLWVEALFIASFLSNLLPSSVHDKMLSPYELLNGKAPVYTALRVFGCACYPNLRPYSQNKFDPKSLMCVFLGYNEKYKGYRCYHPPTGRVYINRHVLFDEDILPYKDTYLHLIPEATTPLSSAWRLQSKSHTSSTPDVNTDGSASAKDIEEQQPIMRPSVNPPLVIPAVVDLQAAEPATSESSQTSQASDHTTPPGSPNIQVQQPLQAPVAPDNSHGMITRAKAGIMKLNPPYALPTVKAIPEVPKSVMGYQAA